MLDENLDVEAIKTLEDAKAALIAAQESKATDNTETLKNATAALLTFEAKLSDNWQKAEAARKAADERIEDLERNLAKAAKAAQDNGDDYHDSTEFKSFMTWVSQGEKGVRDDGLDFKELRTDSNTAGAFLIPQVMDSELRKNITEVSPFRLYARNRVVTSKTMDIPRRLSNVSAYFEGEGEPAQTDAQKYGSESVTVHAQTVQVVATQDMLLMGAVDLEAQIVGDVSEAFAYNEGRLFLLGDGNKQPGGLITDSRVETVETDNTILKFDDFAKMTGSLKRGYNPVWGMNRRTLAHLFTIKDNDANPIWQPVGGMGSPVIYGYGYDTNFIDLEDHDAGTGGKPVIFGDWQRCYEIYDLIGTAVVRDDYTQAARRKVIWTFYRYLTGKVIVPEAGKIMIIGS